uniref:Integrase catalytic domain-containing protein n=1 Tax=Phlebotomus papatasi TaxID=29031 RepID=A0A1B0DEZ6_PHLPP
MAEHPHSERDTVIRVDRLLGQLAPLRALGDFRYKWPRDTLQSVAGPHYGEAAVPPHYHTPPYLTAQPEIKYHRLEPRDKFLVLATDGLWDVLTPLQVVRLVGEHMNGKTFLQPLELPNRDIRLGELSQMLAHRRRFEDDGTPCNFTVKYENLSAFHKNRIQNEIFSYVVLRKKPRDLSRSEDSWPRIVRPVLVRAKHSICRMCTKEGKLQEVIFTSAKHGKLTYQCARRSNWGDRLPINIVNPDPEGAVQASESIGKEGLDNRIVQLLLEDFHVRLGHWRADFVLAELRQRYEIIKGRATLKRLQRGCKTCQVSKAKPQIPLMGQLPSERLSMHVVPFTNTGCDMFGPLYVKSGRSEVKRYGMIFTCMTTRAIHLELCCSLSTDSCLLALRRFFGRRGNPAKIISDNGTNFRGAARELKEAAASLDHAKVKAKLAKMNIEWDFNPPYSPHMGGCWERLIGPVKRALKQSVEITKHPPSEEVLHTLLVEAEHLVNSRPLLELTDSGEVLTPNHFLIHRQSGLTPGGIFEDQDLILRKEWRKSQRLADHFWQIWRKHYAPTLTHRPKWRESGQPIIEGDRVVIMEPNTERNQWIFGRVIKAIPAMDGHARTATIRLEDGSECVRPVTRLAVIRPPPLVMDDDGIGE